MKKIAIVNQRYGKEVNGGSEDYARELAHRLAEYYKVDVITTTAREYQDWREYYPAGTEKDGKVTVRRFPVRLRRITRLQDFLSRPVFHTKFAAWAGDRLWITAQGPYSPGAVRFLTKHASAYDAVIFVTYLYYLTAAGLPKLKDRAILVPTAHDEFPIHYPYYIRLLRAPAALAYLTEEEKKLVEELASVQEIPHVTAGAGVTVPSGPDVQEFRKKYGITDPYVIYAGRVDESKGCGEMFSAFASYKKLHPGSLQLVVIGKMIMQDPGRNDIRCLGFVSEEEKYAAIAGGEILILPSRYESLSISVLEALGLGTPVLVNEGSEVLRAHCEKSGAGRYYKGTESFCTALAEMLENRERLEQMGEKGRHYVQENYTWEKTVQRYRGLIEDMGCKKEK